MAQYDGNLSPDLKHIFDCYALPIGERMPHSLCPYPFQVFLRRHLRLMLACIELSIPVSVDTIPQKYSRAIIEFPGVREYVRQFLDHLVSSINQLRTSRVTC